MNGTSGSSPHADKGGRSSHKKIIYFVRHAEATHNVKEREAVQEVIARGETRKCQQEAARRAVLRGEGSESLRDAPLSANGTEQARDSGRRLEALTTSRGSLFRPPDVVLVSPLRRALMTATELFGGGDDSNAARPRFVAIEALREKRTGLACDERSSVSELRAEFPHVDFTDVEAGLPAVPLGEDNPAVRSRAASYLDGRLSRVDGDYLAIVSHKGWLREFRHTLRERVEKGAIRADFEMDEWHKTLFGNAEVRVGALRWQDGELSSVVSRSVDSALSMVGDGFEFALGPPESGFSMFLASRTTKVHFISLSEGQHNVAVRDDPGGTNNSLLLGDGPYSKASDHPLYDAGLTPKGIAQAERMRDHLAHRPSGFRPFTAFDLVVVSPLTRACETALHIFGQGESPGVYVGMTVPPPRILVREECRERYGRYVCDGRRSVSVLAKEFPTFDFSEMSSDVDELHGDDDVREPAAHCRERAVWFLEWLSARPEGCIAVVTHAEFLRHLFGQFGDTLNEEDARDLQRRAGNCELRSIVLCSHGNNKEVVPAVRDDHPSKMHQSTIRVPSASSPSSSTASSPAPSPEREMRLAF